MVGYESWNAGMVNTTLGLSLQGETEQLFDIRFSHRAPIINILKEAPFAILPPARTSQEVTCKISAQSWPR